MKSMMVLGTLLFSMFAMAETTKTYDVKGMHCGGCAAMIESKVCKMEGVKTCKVEMVDEKNQKGKLTLSTADGKAIEAKTLTEIFAQKDPKTGYADKYEFTEIKK